jgi:hypothetical protein
MSLTTTPTMDTHPNPSIFRELVRIQIRRFFENMATHYTHYALKRVDFSRPASTKTMGYELWQRKKSMSIYWLPIMGEKDKRDDDTSPRGDVGIRPRHCLTLRGSRTLLSSLKPAWLRSILGPHPFRSSSVLRPPTLDQNRTGRTPAS